MKISRNWLQAYFNDPLPSAEDISHALTFHAFEIEGIETVQGEPSNVPDYVLDVKVTANRGHDCLSHRGIAKELAAILQLPLKGDPLRTTLPNFEPNTIEMDIDHTRSPIAVAAYMHEVKIGPSPDWLVERLASVGQRSINNVVDATNYVMLDLGMPTHAFDATTFKNEEVVRYGIRTSQKGEHLTLLGGTFIELSGDEAVITNASGEAVDIGGVKGGARAELSDATTELLLSASKFEPVQTRKAAIRFNQRTEAAKRFENEMADDLPFYGMHALVKLITEIAGGEVVAYGSKRSKSRVPLSVSFSMTQTNTLLGASLNVGDIESALVRLDLAHSQKGETFEVHVPFERLDINIAEDLIEEVARIAGYDKVPSVELAQLGDMPAVNSTLYKMERIREFLVNRGFSEVFTSVFSEKGERMVLNKVDGVRPYLRSELSGSLQEALVRNVRNKDLLGVDQVRLFEIGTVWHADKEEVRIEIAVEKIKKGKTLEEYKQELETEIANIPQNPTAYDVLPLSETDRYQPYSKYPFIVRDVALWTPAGTQPADIENIIRAEAGELLVRTSLFDQFEKEGRVSFAFRLVFQSADRTLFDEDANHRMESVYAALKEKGYEIR